MLHTRNIPSWCLRNGCNLFVLCFFPLGPYSYLCLQPELLSPKLLTYRSVCWGGTSCISNNGSNEMHPLFFQPPSPSLVLCLPWCKDHPHGHPGLTPFTLSLLIQSSTKLCSIYFPGVSRIVLLLLSTTTADPGNHHLSPDCCKRSPPIHDAFCCLVPPQNVPFIATRLLLGKTQLGQRHLPGDKP